MRDWLTIEIALATLLVTTFTLVGTLALWAASSPRHWFLRVGFVLAVLSLPLILPAYEPIVVFTSQTAIILVGVAVWRWHVGRFLCESAEQTLSTEETKQRSTLQFSLVTLLLSSAIVGVLAAIIAKTVHEFPPQNFEALSTLAMNSCAGGCAVTLGAWVFVMRRKRIAWPIALGLCLPIAGIMARFDWLVPSVVLLQNWPTEPMTAGFFSSFSDTHPGLVWFAILPLTIVATWLLLIFRSVAVAVPAASRSSDERVSCRRDARRRIATCFCIAAITIFALPSAVVTWRLLHPLPLPNPAPPQVNGLAKVAAAGRAFSTSPILSTTAEPKSTNELATEIAKYSADYDRLQIGLSQEIRVRDWTPGTDLLAQFDVSLDSFANLRSAARELMRKAELAQQEGRYADAVQASLENVRLGQEIPRDGLLVDMLVGIAIEGIGDSTLYKALSQLNADECRAVIAALDEVERRREPFDAVLFRDRAWSDHADGWSWRFINFLQSFVAPDDHWGSRRAMHRAQAVTRLLMVEAALRSFQLTHGTCPERLEQLSPDYLSELPIDPFDPSGNPLRYAHTDDGHMFAYSVGADGKDNGGGPPARNQYGWVDFDDGDGDFRLDVYMRDDSYTSSPPADMFDDASGAGPSAE